MDTVHYCSHNFATLCGTLHLNVDSKQNALMCSLPGGRNSRARRWRSEICMGCERGTWCGMGCPRLVGGPVWMTNSQESDPTGALMMGSVDPILHSRNDPGWLTDVCWHKRAMIILLLLLLLLLFYISVTCTSLAKTHRILLSSLWNGGLSQKEI